MIELHAASEPVVRLVFFLSVFAIMAIWEAAVPRRHRVASRWLRWPSNLGITVLNTVLLRAVTPTAVAGVALLVQEQSWGLLNQLSLPIWLAVVLAVLVLDLAIYLQHVMLHAVPALWRVHRMHHADLDFDVTTGVRFHPIEIFISAGFKLIVVVAIGTPVVAVLIFEVLLNATSLFNHSNVAIPSGIDRVLRCFVVTPDMHRVHHSVVASETNSNFGFNLPWWDRLLATYRAEPDRGHEDMTIGIEQFRAPGELRLDRMLSQPFRGLVGNYPINRRGN